MAEENQEGSIGALWARKSQNGDYFTGNVEVDGKKVSIVAFYNKNKKEEKHPDYRIYVRKPKDEVPL